MVQDFPGVAFRRARVSRGWMKTITNQNGGAVDLMLVISLGFFLQIHCPHILWTNSKGNSVLVWKIALNNVHCNAAKAAFLNNLQPVSNGGKRGQGDPGRVGFYKWCRNFAVI